MPDIWSKEKRSEVMSLIRSKNTKPERIARKILSGLGYRYRLNVRKIPGSPDISITKYKCAIFIHGCFWHYHSRCRDGKIPEGNRNYWEPKLKANRKRDLRNRRLLKKEGWKVLVLWECQIKKKSGFVNKKLVVFMKDCVRNK